MNKRSSTDLSLRDQHSQVKLQSEADFIIMCSDHKKICEAVINNDPELAAKTMRAHLQYSYENINLNRI